MTDSIRDQLKKLGFKASPTPPKQAKPTRGKSGGKPRKPSTKSGGEMDLAKAYAIRAQKEKLDRIDAEREKQEQARIRREARQQLEKLLEGRTLNDDKADIARHFEYGGKIRRVYVTAAQLADLNAGLLGVVQIRGRYLLVDAATLAEAEAVFADAIALKGPSAEPDVADAAPTAGDDRYADPKYQVPDDLVW
ncbi:MAG TPA: DUF2058 family protein [Xanthomonadaceae bacterium]|nr:DUF2058 family protein [Xanthomonadales bacterium]HPF74864.1 DUF2058 family protein [Xanthomonadaceae bacterium]HRY01323.1 DUF2058 family protein [Xanthomonadaceae bacterium]